MVRSLWAGALAGVLACAAPGWAQSPAKAETKAPAERVITVKEAGKPEQKCRVLRCWTQKDGDRVCEVEDVVTGEKMTILEDVAPKGKSLAQIFRWGKSGAIPAGAPVPPGDVVTTTAERPSLFRRTFASKQPAPAAAPVAKADPRESWGKVERWTAADSEKAVQTASARAEATAPKRPLAATTTHDPLMHPETYAPPMIANTEVATTEVVEKPAAAPRPSLMSRLFTPRTAPEVGPGMGSVNAANSPRSRLFTPKTAAPEVGPGMGSVNAAISPQMAREMDTVMTVDKDGQPVVMPRSVAPPRMVAVDVSAPNAFSTPMPVRPPMAAPTHMPMPPMMMPGGGMMMAGMSMAPAYPPMTGAGMTMPPMMHPATMAMAPMPQPAADPNTMYTATLLHQLHNGQLPSERELAADQLSRMNWRAAPAVVDGLMYSAKADPAPLVRACCVQALGKMKANTVPVVQAVNACKQDADTRVRQAAEQALAQLIAP